jgi:hypothetical protein
MRRLATTLLAGLAVAPSAALFIALLTGSLRQQRLTLEWPQLIDGGDSVVLELLLTTAPGALLVLLASAWLRRGALRVGAFIGGALLACMLAAGLFAQAFGNTWSIREILAELVVAQLHLIALALLPGTLLIALLQHREG